MEAKLKERVISPEDISIGDIYEVPFKMGWPLETRLIPLEVLEINERFFYANLRINGVNYSAHHYWDIPLKGKLLKTLKDKL